jgi:hypothetical protein
MSRQRLRLGYAPRSVDIDFHLIIVLSDSHSSGGLRPWATRRRHWCGLVVGVEMGRGFSFCVARHMESQACNSCSGQRTAVYAHVCEGVSATRRQPERSEYHLKMARVSPSLTGSCYRKPWALLEPALRLTRSRHVRIHRLEHECHGQCLVE